MQKFFGFDKGGSEGINTVPEWNYLRSGFQANLETVMSYYRMYAGRVDASHLLIKLIYGVGVTRSLPLDRFYAVCVAKTDGITMANKLTSSVNKGQLFDGVFYGTGTKEVIIGHDDSFDYEDAAENWENLEPIKVLRHPKSDLSLNIPDGTVTSNEDGVAVIAINIPMLALQYRQWKAIEDARALRAGDNPKGITHFIFNYPLTNMLPSHLDQCIFNRLYNLLNGIPFGQAKYKHSFYITDFSKKLNEVQMKQLEILRASPKHFNTLLRTVPMVSVPSLADLAVLPEVAHTRQIIWALALARLQMLSFLFKVTRLRPRSVNAAEINRILWNLYLYRTDKALQSTLPLSLYFDAKKDLDILKS